MQCFGVFLRRNAAGPSAVLTVSEPVVLVTWQIECTTCIRIFEVKTLTMAPYCWHTP